MSILYPTYTKKNGVHHASYEFFSYDQFVETVHEIEQNPLQSNASETKGASWSGTKDYQQALDFSIRGWTSGAKSMRKMYEETMEEYFEPLQSSGLDMAGAYPIVPEYLAGEEACMVNPDLSRRVPTCNILLDIGFHSGISDDDIMFRGMCVLAMVDDAEQMGISCAITINSNATYSKFVEYMMTAPIKSYGQHYDLDRCAYNIVNPSILRRLDFRLKEATDPKETDGIHMGRNGYGTPRQVPDDLANQYDVVIPATRTDPINFRYKEKEYHWEGEWHKHKLVRAYIGYIFSKHTGLERL